MLRIFQKAPDCELVVVARLDSDIRLGGSGVRDARSAVINDLGLADAIHCRITSRQPAETPPDQWVLYDRLSIKLDEKRHKIGWISIREQYAYDLHYRSEINLTGLRVEMHLSRNILDGYENYLGNLAFSNPWRSWKSVIFRIPVRAFVLPARRGGFQPSDKAVVGRLRKISRFEIDKIEIQKLADPQGEEVQVRDGLPEPGSSLPLPLIAG